MQGNYLHLYPSKLPRRRPTRCLSKMFCVLAVQNALERHKCVLVQVHVKRGSTMLVHTLSGADNIKVHTVTNAELNIHWL